jgi:hypothetical protein
MSGSRVENGHLFDLQGQIRKQRIVEVVDELIEIAAWSRRRGLQLPGVG